MENASKALAMAGAVLIALLIIGVLVYMVQNAGELKRQEQNEERLKQIIEFNREYESYEKTLMRGTDVISAINMANDYNSKNVYDVDGNKVAPELEIKASVTLKSSKLEPTVPNHDYISSYIQKSFKNSYIRIPAPGPYTINIGDTITGGSDKYIAITLDEKVLTEFKRKFFKCTKIRYSEITGRVNEIAFVEIDVGKIPD